MAIIINTTLAINGVLGLLVFVLVVYLIDTLTRYQKEKQIYGMLSKTNVNRKDIIRNNRLLKNYNHTLKRFFQERKKENYAPIVFYLTLVVCVLIFMAFISMKQILFAVLAPIIIIWVLNKIFFLLLVDVNEKVDDQLPYVIDTIIKVFSKYGDLKSVVYETSQGIDEPLKSRFESLVRRMLSENQEKAIMDFADEMNNIWIYSLVFILLSYQGDTKKEEVIVNLRHLATIIEKENSLKNSSVTDKRYGVVLNYAIAILAGAGEVANILFNPVGKDFFFGSMGGLLCFVIGNGALVMTIILNIKLASKKGRR
ncbi:pilus assembly protein TadB (plasmid) [Aneurinibacillus sp. Ricciae_BoGa-3]|uniref:pilus assembly protein TadB n=1 Tax=Aneurinibacillus sp. Ricciae_BoGa-3 TaxID=3022697 RepID=UPI0023423B21|nr:pilus assembly protein TadB [Aneurinibacillus sp. Ricciae_BoGa-3]WCK57695.1 pilus assembly protein TadB [Aneurinibacillus sp. Ricciae_BoGa-3]